MKLQDWAQTTKPEDLHHNLSFITSEKAMDIVKTEENVNLWENAEKDNGCSDYHAFHIITMYFILLCNS